MGRPRLTPTPSVTPERASRFARLIRLVGKTPRERTLLLDKLDVDLRGFYRDVRVLRDLSIDIKNSGSLYFLNEGADEARAKLPCPDPQLTVAELQVVAKGNTEAHRKLKRLLETILGSTASNGNSKR
jgi:predicted DNA-binding transcriptional regulator YafY